MPMSQLLLRYTEVYGKAPRIKHREHLWKRIAWRLQEQRLGGLTNQAKERIGELVADLDLPLSESRRTIAGALRERGHPSDPGPGSVLVKEWHGNEYRVTMLEEGCEYEGAVFRSLSAVARAITGAHWNGRLFFGLTTRKRASDRTNE